MALVADCLWEPAVHSVAEVLAAEAAVPLNLAVVSQEVLPLRPPLALQLEQHSLTHA